LGIFFLRAAPWGAEAAQKLPDGQISLVMTMDCFAAFVHPRVAVDRACRTLKRDVHGGRFFLLKKNEAADCVLTNDNPDLDRTDIPEKRYDRRSCRQRHSAGLILYMMEPSTRLASL
jgi:hypothetical protein